MSITEQYLLDTYRARQLGEPAPPAPGTHEWQAVREWRDRRQFLAVVAGRPARGRIRHGLGRWLSPRSTA
ncbi:hypothetical protein [Streptomyces sp. S.PNR 29]|uniref:hypothetical protein n=1 Tax=Streptomyces sp. S.PNR 29 TaxID=2973805 RepID=UPI0025B157E8|nr:hypothetical protein [Streptomyces sp. S.PNR 29]MDN0198026.1 hypothetical protein [Streptomyces sp. S.PNR 29]